MRKLFRFLIKPPVLMFLGILLLMAFVYYIGPLLRIEGPQRTNVALLVGGIAFIFYLIFWIRAYLKERKLTRELKSQARRQAEDAGSDAEQDIKLLEREFERAFDELSRLKGGGGIFDRSSVADLPWIIIMGPPGAGKSTALEASNLHFTPLGRHVAGTGGTRNCEWWLSEEAIFLDTAGRYTTVREEDHAEWLSFLGLLRQQRKRRPIDTVVLQIGLETIVHLDNIEAQKIAIQLQHRMDELLQELKVRFPIHLVFSKCDRLEGFTEYMESLTEDERQRPWGFCLDTDKLEGAPLQRAFIERYEAMVSAVHTRATLRVRELPTREAREKALAFPQELARQRDKLELFTDTLFQPSRHRERPWLTTIYFVSATQEGRTLSSYRRELISQYGGGEAAEVLGEARIHPYFVKGLFERVVAEAQDAARPNSSAIRTMKIQQLVTVVALAMVCFAITLYLGKNFQEDFLWLDTTLNRTLALSTLQNIGGPEQAADDPVYRELDAEQKVEKILGEREPEGLLAETHKLTSAYLRQRVDKQWIVPLKRAIDAQLMRGASWRARNRDGEQFADGYLALKAAHVVDQAVCQGSDPEDTRFWMGSYLAGLWVKELGERARDVLPGSASTDLQNRIAFFFAGKDPSRIKLDENLRGEARVALQGELPDEDVVFYLIAANAGLTAREIKVKGNLFGDPGIQKVFTPNGCQKFLSSSNQGTEWWSCLLNIQEPPALGRNKAYKKYFYDAKGEWLTGLSFQMEIDSLKTAIDALTYVEQGADAELDQILDTMGGQALLAERKRKGSLTAGVPEGAGSTVGFLKGCARRAEKTAQYAKEKATDPTCQEAQRPFASYATALADETQTAKSYLAYKDAIKEIREHLRRIDGSTNGNKQALDLVLATMRSEGNLYGLKLAREDFFTKLEQGPPRTEAQPLQELLTELERAIWRSLLPKAGQALQAQWTIDIYQPYTDIRYRENMTRADEPAACEKIIGFLESQVEPYLNRSLRPFYVDGNLRRGALNTFLGERMPLARGVSSMLERSMQIMRTLECPEAPEPSGPVEETPKYGIPLLVEKRGPSCGNDLVWVRIDDGESQHYCKVATQSCNSSPYQYTGARIVMGLQKDLGPGRTVYSASDYQTLIGKYGRQRGSVFTFKLDKYCDGMYFELKLKSEKKKKKKSSGPKKRVDPRWKNRHLLPRNIIGGGR